MPDRAAPTPTEFLRRVLAGGALRVPELEAKARAARLLGKRQSITHAKRFIRAKKMLGIRSVRRQFGLGGEWTWLLPPQPASPATDPTSGP